jgi:hypothetical protein
VWFFSPPLWSKTEKNKKHPPAKIFKFYMWNILRASKALFSSPSIWSYMGGYFACGFFLLLCGVKQKKTKNTHPPRFFNFICGTC